MLKSRKQGQNNKIMNIFSDVPVSMLVKRQVPVHNLQDTAHVHGYQLGLHNRYEHKTYCLRERAPLERGFISRDTALNR